MIKKENKKFRKMFIVADLVSLRINEKKNTISKILCFTKLIYPLIILNNPQVDEPQVDVLKKV